MSVLIIVLQSGCLADLENRVSNMFPNLTIPLATMKMNLNIKYLIIR